MIAADIGYAKEQFNVLYEMLKKIFESGIARPCIFAV